MNDRHLPPGARHPALAMGLYAAAAALAIASVALTTLGDDGTPVSASAPAPSHATQALAGDDIDDSVAQALLRRVAANALLVPLLDDDSPPRWTDVAANFFCEPATRIEIDGQPMLPGARIPATAFTLRWHMDRCRPLDAYSLELSGIVELLVFHEDTGLSAVVDADRLTVTSADGISRPGGIFGASMSLAEAAHRP